MLKLFNQPKRSMNFLSQVLTKRKGIQTKTGVVRLNQIIQIFCCLYRVWQEVMVYQERMANLWVFPYISLSDQNPNTHSISALETHYFSQQWLVLQLVQMERTHYTCFKVLTLVSCRFSNRYIFLLAPAYLAPQILWHKYFQYFLWGNFQFFYLDIFKRKVYNLICLAWWLLIRMFYGHYLN